MSKKKRLKSFLGLVAALIIFGVLFWFFSPQALIHLLGVENALVLLFFLGILGAFFPWTAPSFVTLLVTLVLGGTHFAVVGLVAGLGVAVGDMLVYHIGLKARALIPRRWDKRLKKFERMFSGSREKWIPLVSFIYIALTPFPNELLILFLVSIEYPKKNIYPVIIIGDLIYSIGIASLALLI